MRVEASSLYAMLGKRTLANFRATSRDNEQDEVVIDDPTEPHIQDNDGITLKQQILVNIFTL
jgi:hypothetical protein